MGGGVFLVQLADGGTCQRSPNGSMSCSWADGWCSVITADRVRMDFPPPRKGPPVSLGPPLQPLPPESLPVRRLMPPPATSFGEEVRRLVAERKMEAEARQMEAQIRAAHR